MLDTYWMLWTTLFPSVPFWSPHGAEMTLILAAAITVLSGKYCWNVFRRT